MKTKSVSGFSENATYIYLCQTTSRIHIRGLEDKFDAR